MKTFPIIIIVLLLTAISCSSPSHLIKNGQYDQAIEKISKKARSGKVKEDQIQQLDQAFRTANQLDQDRIILLKSSGRPDIWLEVYDLYQTMNDRQQIMKSLPIDVQNKINFVPIDLNSDLNASKAKAELYLYAKAESLLKSADRQEARKAHAALIDLERINPDYPGLSSLLQKATDQGTNQVLIMFENQTGLSIPITFSKEILSFSSSDFDSEYVAYDLEEDADKTYDYVIYISLKNVSVSPEKLETRKFVEKKEIKDGTQAKRDENGDIMLDSTGKVIEEVRYRLIEAIVNETFMSKSALLKGSIDFVATKDKHTLKSTPFEVTTNFAHSFAVVNGDLNACKEPTLEMMRRGPVPFPPDIALIMDASQQLNQIAKTTIRRERGLVKNVD